MSRSTEPKNNNHDGESIPYNMAANRTQANRKVKNSSEKFYNQINTITQSAAPGSEDERKPSSEKSSAVPQTADLVVALESAASKTGRKAAERQQSSVPTSLGRQPSSSAGSSTGPRAVTSPVALAYATGHDAIEGASGGAGTSILGPQPFVDDGHHMEADAKVSADLGDSVLAEASKEEEVVRSLNVLVSSPYFPQGLFGGKSGYQCE